MDNDNKKPPPLQQALHAIDHAPQAVAHELRLMAQGADPYQRFRLMSPWIKNVWRAAAELLEKRS